MNKFMAILGLLPGILQTVIAVENSGAFPSGSGMKKQQLVLNSVSVAAGSVPEVASLLQRHEIEGATQAMIQSSVAALNAAGVFKQNNNDTMKAEGLGRPVNR